MRRVTSVTWLMGGRVRGNGIERGGKGRIVSRHYFLSRHVCSFSAMKESDSGTTRFTHFSNNSNFIHPEWLQFVRHLDNTAS
ncbi:hypothetical protein E2C01_044297 [Portunus trituberculatus]|uniref:Uncharacterized protein n=1 Tax=Portunus trituberculatus TaxID=210409 RepID=A0A5B7G020_PORTR|nr:hypothetical protein [Portunus trituberculatus]